MSQINPTQLVLSGGDVTLDSPANDQLDFVGSSSSVDVTGVDDFTCATSFQSGSNPLGGHCVTFAGEIRNVSTGFHFAFGSGGVNTNNGIVMIYPGQVVALSLTSEVSATDITATIERNRSSTAFTVSALGSQVGTSNPVGLTFSAGDELNAEVTTANPSGNGLILTFFIRFDP